jgi:predicted amidohydrolase
MIVAAIHFGKGSDLEENRRNLLSLNIKAAQDGADLIVNPELSVLPLFPASSPIQVVDSKAESVAKSRAFARTLAEETTPALVELFLNRVVAPYGKHVVIGAITCEQGYNIFHNSAFILGPNGVHAPANGICHVYHKRELHGDVFAAKGTSELWPAQLGVGNVGVLICSDCSVPLIARCLALNGSDIIVIPAAITGPTSSTLRVRSLENGIPFALANSYEHDEAHVEGWMPESAIVAADGRVIESCNSCENTILMADLDLTSAEAERRKADSRRHRRPRLYQGALIDLTSRVLRDRCSLPPKAEICVITVSSGAVQEYAVSNPVRELIASLSEEDVPVILVLPELLLERNEVEPHLSFAKARKLYVVCGFVEKEHRIISMFDRNGLELLSYKKVHLSPDDERNGICPGDRLEYYVDLPIGRIGVLAGQDLVYPEALELHRNAAVDLILVPSQLDFDGEILFEDIARYRHLNLAVADGQHKGGIYKRSPDPHTSNKNLINNLRFDTQQGRIEPSKGLPLIAPFGLDALLRIEPPADIGQGGAK